jgi:hypothetical protein
MERWNVLIMGACSMRRTVNGNLNRWDVGMVWDMAGMIYGASDSLVT